MRNETYMQRRIREIDQEIDRKYSPKKRKLRWDRIIGVLFILFMIGSFIDIAIAKPVVKTTPVGNYECKGHILKVCSGADAVANYLGVE